MGTHKQVIEIDALINTKLGNLNDTVSKLQKGISQGVTKMDLSKGTGKALTGHIRAFKDEYDEFQKYIKTDSSGKSFVDFEDSGKVIASGKHLLKVFEDIQQVMHGINSKDAVGFDKLFPQGKIGDADDLLKSLEKVEPKLRELQEKQTLRITLTGDITSIETRLAELKAELAEDTELHIDVSGATEELEKATQQVEDLQKKLQESLQTKIGNVQGDLTRAQTDRTKKEEQLRANKAAMDQTGIYFTSSGKMEYQGMSKGQWENATKKRTPEQREIAKNAFEQYERIAAESASIEAELAQMDAKIAATTKNLTDLIALAEKVKSPEGMASVEGGELAAAGVDAEQVENVTAALERQTKAQLDLNNARAQEAARTQKQEEVETLTADLETKKKQVEQLGDAIAKLSEKANLSQLTEKLKDLGFDEVTEDSLKSEEGIKKIREALSNMSGERLEKVKTELKNMGIIAEDTNGNIKLAAGALQKFDDNRGALSRTQQDMESLKNRMLDFFSITNTVQLFKKAVTQAFNSVKELDAVMTQTAVVTDFSVGDMWDKLPEYTAQANSLGASVASLYEATTLYYQQGLDTNAAMGVGVETMKMARIAGMDAAAATEAMTAALRGFNMEVNELNATRVNDVYSELAAITAADTEQIATAMGKTASIAASANMEFETTAALLAQIIETTQEAPETAGTAMKTIIARFTEVKSLFSQGQLTGEDTEGEAIDINKIDTALKSVGISLKDFLNGEKGIDDIFLELASKWDSLDLATQRYIATTAAGSRQQSRFIAMMSDYGRTMELVGAANNSAGASQRQFDKTQESLEAKLQKLKNAWQEFTMNIMNSDVIKSGVDALTKILDTVNSLINALSGGNGLIKGVLSLGIAFGTLKLGNSVLSGSLKYLGEKTFFGQMLPTLKNVKEPSGGKATLSFNEVKQNVISGIRKGLETIISAGRQFKTCVLEGATGAAEIEKAGEAEGTIIENSGEVEGTIIENSGETTAAGIEVAGETAGAKIEVAGEAAGAGAKGGLGGASLLPLLKTAAVAIATAAVIAAIVYAVDRAIETDKEKRERLEKQVEHADNQSKEIRSKRDSTKSDIANFRQLEKGFENLKAGTAEWREQLAQVNEQALALVEKYPELKLETGAFGQLSISEESYNNFLNQQQEQLGNLNAIKASANLELEEMDYSDTLDKYRIVRDGYKTVTIHNAQEGDVQVQQSAWEDWTTNLSNEQIRNMMSAFAQSGINSTNISDNQDIAKKIIMAQGVDETEANSLLGKIVKLGIGFDELSVASLQASIKMDTFADSFFTSAAESRKDQNISDEAANNFLELAYGGAQGLKERTTAREKELLANNSDAALLQEYAKQMGYYYSGGKVYTDSSMKEVIEVTREGAASAIADSLIKDEATAAIDHLNLNTQQEREEFEKYFGSERANLSLAEARELKAEDLAALLGTSEQLENNQDYREGLEQYIEAIQTAVEVNQIETAKYFAKYEDSYEGQEITGDTYKDIIASLTLQTPQSKIPNFNELLTSAMQSVEKSGDNELANQVFDALTQTQNIANPKYFETASELISSIDWSNPIEAMDQISKAMENGDEITRDFASQLNALGSHFLGLGSQVQYFVESTDFTEMQGDIQKIIDKSGELTGMDIMELADDYKSLQKIIDNNQVSVAGLAKVFSELGENGSLGVYQLTNAVLAAASGFDSLDGVVAEALDAIDNFDPGLSETDVIDFSEKAYKTLTENFEKGYWGNSQNFEYLDFFFGPDWDKDQFGKALSGDALKAKMQELTNIIGNGEEGFKKAWSNLLNGKDLSQFDGMSSEQIVGKIMEETGYSEQYAQMLLTYMKNINPDFAAALQTTDLRTGLDNAFKEANVANGQKILDASEISAIADIYGVAEDKVRQYFENRGALITNIYDKDGILKETDEIIKEIEKIYGEDTKGKWTLSDDGSMARERLVSVGITNKKDQDRILDEYYAQKVDEAEADENGKKSITVSEKTSYGTTTELTITPKISYSEAMAAAEAKALANIYAQAFGETLGATGIDAVVNFDGEAIRTALQAILADPFSASVNLTTTVTTTPTVNMKPGDYLQYGTIGGAAKGIKNSPRTHDSLVSEEGPELIQRADGTAYLSGLNGPEITKIHRGDTVYTAEETRKIYSNHSKGFMPRFAAGTGIAGTARRVFIDTGGSEEPQSIVVAIKVKSTMSEEDAWKELQEESDENKENEENKEENEEENNNIQLTPVQDTAVSDSLRDIQDFLNNNVSGLGSSSAIGNLASEEKTSLDKLYNLLASIEETTRQRERLERRYESLIKDANSSIKDVVKNSREQLAVLESEKDLQEALIKGREAQIEAYMAQNSGYAQYAGVETNEYGDQVVRIDWDAINAISNDDERKKVEEYVSKIEGWVGEIADAEDTLWDIEDAVEEINERGKEEYLDFENQIKDALLAQYQEEIDQLSAIDEAINKGNASMIQAIQDTISKQRQERDNARTEEELAEKERRLQYLKQDTSGANALEILELEKELAEGREDYTDTLIDQKIEELQKQNDQAAEQRQKQIEVLTKQKEIYERSEQLWKNVYDLISNGIDNNGIIIPGSNLEALLQNVVSKEGLSMIGTEDWWKETTESIKAGMAWLQMGQQLENLGVTSGSIDFVNGDGKTLKGTVQGNGDVKVGNQIYKDVYRDATGNYRTLEKEQTETSDKNEKPEVEAPTFPYGKFSEVYSRELAKSHSGDDVKALQWALQQLNYLSSDYKIEGKFDDITDQAVRAFQAAAGLNADGVVGKNTREAFRLKKFKTGGVADFTGPAWLDGTKSRPEIILNQQDSRNFIQLKDILSSVLNGSASHSTSTENNRDVVYDIDINVEKLEKEVDLDTISNYVERKITETARYRNNNAVRISR